MREESSEPKLSILLGDQKNSFGDRWITETLQCVAAKTSATLCERFNEPYDKQKGTLKSKEMPIVEV